MATDQTPEVYDLLLLVDATGSMSHYLASLRISLPKIISISKLTNSFARIGLLAYRDYTEGTNERSGGLLEWSGWYSHEDPDGPGRTTARALMRQVDSLQSYGGGDFPEAAKTALARAYSLMREDATTILMLYTDAPPHCWTVSDRGPYSNWYREQRALKKESSYDSLGPRFADWVEGCNLLHSGPRKAHVFCFLDDGLSKRIVESSFYLYLSTITRGACMHLTETKSHNIAHVTVEVLLAWMGVEKPGTGVTTLPATLVRYKAGDDIKRIENEKDPVANSYFWSHDPTVTLRRSPLHVKQHEWRKKATEQLTANQVGKPLDPEVLQKYLPKKKTKVVDFAQRYLVDGMYKNVVIQELGNIMDVDVTSISLNPVFGSLWRQVCNDRGHSAREELIAKFGLSVDKIEDADEKTRMRNWLEESYDYAAEILDTLEAVPQDQRYPCVFLDPTIEFRPARKKDERTDDQDEEDDRQITAFRRDELLEIGRSCDGRILRRIGKVLTRMTYVESADKLPSHIAAATMAEVPRIPIALASQAHGWKFWKILLHAIVPGTMLSTRPAMVLAALAMRIGVKPLFEPASSALLFWRDKWNNLEVPETWNVGCLGLLLDADDEYQRQMNNNGDVTTSNSPGLLLPADRQLFSQLIAYKLLQANFCTTLMAEVSWTPQKTQLPIGHVVTCRRCKHPRSVTIMAEKSGGQCGLCVASDWKDAAHKERAIAANITDSGKLAWVECCDRKCHSQYVCYNPGDLLGVRPKCHYCRRNLGQAPTVECVKCRSKVIWPKEWRAAVPTPFHCVACVDGQKTVVSVNTTAEDICKENGHAWLLRKPKDTLNPPFKGSLFRTIKSIGPEAFLANVQVLPAYGADITLRGKPIQNQTALRSTLETWIYRRAAEKTPCSLCFSEIPNPRLLPACRRRGCYQKVCEKCLDSWYGLNSVGCIINPAAVCCPFCRRPASARTLHAYGKGIHAVGDLMKALRERGQWIHAWCQQCGNARRLMERECARGAPEPVEQFTCEDCRLHALEVARAAEEAARQLAEQIRHLRGEERDRVLREAERRHVIAVRQRAELEYPVKKCPGCGVRSQKSYGCDHVTCPVKTCGIHWCWRCVQEFSQRDIYEHMDKEHGGWDGGDEGAWGHVRYVLEDTDDDWW